MPKIKKNSNQEKKHKKSKLNSIMNFSIFSFLPGEFCFEFSKMFSGGKIKPKNFNKNFRKQGRYVKERRKEQERKNKTKF